jgi:hypothetical protein
MHRYIAFAAFFCCCYSRTCGRTIRVFCCAVQVRRRPAPLKTSKRRTGSGLDLSKSSVSDTCLTARLSGRTFARHLELFGGGLGAACFSIARPILRMLSAITPSPTQRFIPASPL